MNFTVSRHVVLPDPEPLTLEQEARCEQIKSLMIKSMQEQIDHMQFLALRSFSPLIATPNTAGPWRGAINWNAGP